MATTSITITGAERTERLLRNVQRVIPILLADKRNEISNMLLRRVDERFEKKRTEKGVPWKSLVAGNFPRKSGRSVLKPKRSQILDDTGLLRSSISRLSNAGGKVNVDGRSAFGFAIGVTGAAEEYAGVHQFGKNRSPLTGGPIPRRRFLGVNKADAQFAADIVVQGLVRIIRKSV